jgi:hypothetical protein
MSELDLAHRRALLPALVSAVFLMSACGGDEPAATTTDTDELLVEEGDAAAEGEMMEAAQASKRPPLGTSYVQTSVDTIENGTAEAFKYRARSTATGQSVQIYLDGKSSASRVIVGVYSDSNDAPSKLLATGTITSPVAGAWNVVGIPPVAIQSGTDYWIAVMAPEGDGGTLKFRAASYGGKSVSTSSTTLTAMPAAWSTGQSWPSTAMSAYVSTSTGPTPPPPPPPDGGTWVFVAKEWQSFVLPAPARVRYGIGSSWVMRDLLAGTVPCTNDFFGSDPAYGVTKSCEVMPTQPCREGSPSSR